MLEMDIGDIFKYIDVLGAWHHEVTEVVTQLSLLVDGWYANWRCNHQERYCKWIGSRAKDRASVFALGYLVALVG